MSLLYNTATVILTVATAALLLFIVIEFKTMGSPNQNANMPGHDYEGRISDGIKASPGLTTKEFK